MKTKTDNIRSALRIGRSMIGRPPDDRQAAYNIMDEALSALKDLEAREQQAHPQTEDLGHALDELLTEVSCVIHSNGSRPIDIECLKSCYDKYHDLIHRDMMDILGDIAGSAKPGPVVTHLNMDPNASPETIEAVKDMVQAAYKYKPQTEDLEAHREELIEMAARFFTEDGVYHPADNYYIVKRGSEAGDCARIIAGYLMDITQSRSLSPSKGVDEQVEEIVGEVRGHLFRDQHPAESVEQYLDELYADLSTRLKTLLTR